MTNIMPTVLLALDPSSSVTGYAVSCEPHRIMAGGLLVPKKKDDPIARSFSMASDAAKLVIEHGATHCIIETPAPQAPGGRIGARGQAIYGMAVGIILATIKQVEYGFNPLVVETVASDVWTRKQKKQTRQRCVMSIFSNYDPKTDPGMDMSDAIALGQWWWNQQAMKKAGV